MSSIALADSGPRSRTKPVLAALLLALVAAAGWIGATAAPAHAATKFGCPATYFCFYADPGLDPSTGMGKVTGDNKDFRAFSTSKSNCGNKNWDNCISSIFNNGTSCTVYVWTSYNWTGDVHSLSRGDGVTNLGKTWPSFDDNISSNHWCTSR